MSREDATSVVTIPAVVLESGTRLENVDVAYRTWGRLDRDRGNAVLVCHGLTGSADLDTWWGALLGPGLALDPEADFVVCSNTLGGCAGTTGPTAMNPATGRPYAADFPAITIRDMVQVQAALLAALGVRRLRWVVGGSLGGLQALEWAVMYPDRVEAAAVIAASGRHSAWCIAWSEAQRQAIFADPDWRDGSYDRARPPAAGLAAARMMAMVSYRSRASFERRFGRRRPERGGFAVESYLRHHGRALVGRFDANSYVTLTRAMDTHDVARDRGDYVEVLGAVSLPVLVVGITTDVLYLPEEQLELVQHLGNGRFAELESLHGHDGFLVDARTLDPLLAAFRRELAVRPSAARSSAAAGGRP